MQYGTAQPSKNHLIFVFDSGMGGLSILDEVRQQCNNCKFVYISDPEYVPYGDKSSDEVYQRLLALLMPLLPLQPDLLILACNTVSTMVLSRLRQVFEFPIVGVVPAIKPAAQLSVNKVIGLLATPWTVSSDYTAKLIAEHGQGARVIRHGSLELVRAAEAKARGVAVPCQLLQDELGPFLVEPKPDVIVLGCTHFPLLRQELSSLLPTTQFLDSSVAVAKRVGFLLTTLKQQRSYIPCHDYAVFQSLDPEASATTKAMASFGLTAVSSVELQDQAALYLS